MAASLSEIIAELDGLLEPERFADYCVNGLQVPGPGQVETVVTGVSANAELLEHAARERADLVLVHHGLFWDPGVRSLDAIAHGRLKLLLGADMALAAYHLPLDAHTRVGNNALIAHALDAEQLGRFAPARGEPIGILARLPGEGVAAGDLLERVRAATGREPLWLDGGPPTVSTIGIVSGGGADYLGDAAAAGAQALLTGEPEERSPALAREHGVHLIAAGHHATETFGVRALGEHLAERFGVRHAFVDIANPV
ncbi:MAG TPA: Nif3-like dinuclear metal center hexameric protein [Solirubrobacteraceae bacterium]|nr:Nif3-like dinuclear metal center hexameric protein [Solirubrobacteraceae bacterium]